MYRTFLSVTACKACPLHPAAKLVLYIPELPINLISSTQLRKNGVYFSTLANTLRTIEGNTEIGYAPKSNGLNVIAIHNDSPEAWVLPFRS